MDLKEFYFQNIKESEYHYRFLNSIKKVNYTYNIFCGEEETQNYQFEIDDVECVRQVKSDAKGHPKS